MKDNPEVYAEIMWRLGFKRLRSIKEWQKFKSTHPDAYKKLMKEVNQKMREYL